MPLLIGVCAGIVLFSCILWSSYLIALYLIRTSSASVRWCSTIVVAYWLAVGRGRNPDLFRLDDPAHRRAREHNTL